MKVHSSRQLSLYAACLVLNSGIRRALKRPACLMILCLAFPAAQDVGAAPLPDAEVLVACIDAVFAGRFVYQSARKRKVVHVLPNGENSMGGSNHAQIARDFPDANWQVIKPLLDSVHSRLANWVPPQKLSSSIVSIRVKEPRKFKISGYRDAFVSFWPPGFDSTRSAALVVAYMGPSSHGEKAACHLEKSNDSWVVVEKWTVAYL